MTEHVIAEVTEPSQAAALDEAIRRRLIIAIEVTEPAELALFAELRRILGAGEAAAIAVAFHRDLAVATDDGKTRREINQRLGPGRLMTTPGILLQAIRSGMLTIADADKIKAQLERHKFRMSFASFADLFSA